MPRKTLTEDELLGKSIPLDKDLISDTDTIEDRRWDYMGYDFSLVRMPNGRVMALRCISILHVETQVEPDEHGVTYVVAIWSKDGRYMTWDSPEKIREAIASKTVMIGVV